MTNRALLEATKLVGRLVAIALVGAVLSSCTTGVYADTKAPVYGSDLASPPAKAQSYGVEGTLTDVELNALFNLSFPQSYEAIKNRLGFPAYRDQQFDYFRVAGTDHWVAVEYAGDQAVSYHVGD